MAGRIVEAWIRGMEAARDGLSQRENPHPRGTELAGHWQDGWRDGDRQRREAEASDGAGQAHAAR